jgi:hypothetical protein
VPDINYSESLFFANALARLKEKETINVIANGVQQSAAICFSVADRHAVPASAGSVRLAMT